MQLTMSDYWLGTIKTDQITANIGSHTGHLTVGLIEDEYNYIDSSTADLPLSLTSILSDQRIFQCMINKTPGCKFPSYCITLMT